MKQTYQDYTAEDVIARLEGAGTALMGLPSNSPKLAAKVASYGYTPELIKGFNDAVGDRTARLTPNQRQITEMDEAFGWLAFIPVRMKRRIVAARSMVTPQRQTVLFSWRDIGKMVGADYHACQTWHAQGINDILRELLA